MLYLNFKTIRELEEGGHDALPLLSILSAINQSNFNYLESQLKRIEDTDFTYKGKPLIKRIKKKSKSQPDFETLRLDTMGKELLKEVVEAEVSEEDEIVFNWLSEHYKKIGKEIGNGAKTRRHIKDFRIKSGISKNNLLRVCLAFISDQDNMEYSHKLEYLFYKPKTVFETRFDLEESRLYQYYLKHKEHFDKQFEDET